MLDGRRRRRRRSGSINYLFIMHTHCLPTTLEQGGRGCYRKWDLISLIYISLEGTNQSYPHFHWSAIFIVALDVWSPYARWEKMCLKCLAICSNHLELALCSHESVSNARLLAFPFLLTSVLMPMTVFCHVFTSSNVQV